MIRTPRALGIERALTWIITSVFCVILALLPFHAFLSTWGGTAVGPLLVWKSWKEILIAGLVPIIVWLCFIRRDVAKTIWSRWYNKLIAVYVLQTLIMAALSDASNDAVVAGLLMNLRFLALFIVGQVIVAARPQWLGTIKKYVSIWLVATGALLGIMALAQVTIVPKDFLARFGYDKDTTISPYLLVDEDPNALRAFATMRGPNTLAAYLLLPLAAALLMWYEGRRWGALAASALMVGALFATHSRSAWLGLIAMLAVLAYATLPREQLRRWIKFGTIPALLIAGLVIWAATMIPAVRLAIFHSGGNSASESLTEGSSDEHWQAVIRGLQDIVAQPLGAGVGSAGPASFYNTAQVPRISESYYVQLGQEVGILGLALFLMISFHVWRSLHAQTDFLPRALLASFAGIMIINLFLHGWADDPTALTWWGIAGLFIVNEGKKHARK